ncbi:hypothetical protein [Qipengyuania gelatinilytica]|uniref:Uncharacterized protein n=1 Tax=Qipengyuania gelatinilytica TaxID=2867231 RepID=A0ABX8ZYT9_9SPHN|nr:hypothetical protein [Qipengyuania gelatinilytica]QZD94059.1 hypothetical protein K3136_08020 [Qipengyuania gelatinilytica]
MGNFLSGGQTRLIFVRSVSNAAYLTIPDLLHAQCKVTSIAMEGHHAF